ncbi:hypothetical protein G3I74_06410 [Wenzhouxiangella sp. C33]|uniref:Uncharacterized protein n=1 Tax=Wenzhouxiangella limi TaxID=2707351 RepID=A0A845UXX1_9GAMM|nr:hypothetical protein [Wenzhouxiangella limi]
MASAPSQTDFIELHIKHVSGGGFAGQVFDSISPKDILRCQQTTG